MLRSRLVSVGRRVLVPQRAVHTTPALLGFPRTQPIPENWDAILYPSDSLGNVRDDNWSMVIQHVAPRYNAYRNFDFSKEAEPKVTEDTLPVPVTVVRDNRGSELADMVPPYVDARFEDASPVRYEKIFDKLTEELSLTQHVYVHDFDTCWTNLRVVTDDPATAYRLSKLTGHTTQEVINFALKSSVVYHSSNFNPVASGLKLDSPRFSILDPCLNAVVIGGSRNYDTIVNALCSLLANNLSLDSAYGIVELTMFRCDTHVTPTQTVALFGARNYYTPKSPSRSHAMVAGHGKFFSVFGPQSEELPNLERVVLVTNDASNTLPLLSSLSPEQAVHHFFYGRRSASEVLPCFAPHPVDATVLAERFGEIIKDTSVYLVNEAAASKEVVTSIVEGLANGAGPKFINNKALGLRVCTDFPNVDMRPRRPSSESVKQFSEKRAQELAAFHGVVPDSVMKGAVV